jgi:hypothetical protein
VARIGTAIFQWDTGYESTGVAPFEHQLGAPLRAIRPAVRHDVRSRLSLDQLTETRFSLHDPIHETIGVIRYEDNQDTFARLLNVASRYPVIYIPSSGSTGDAHECFLIFGDPVDSDMDADRGFPGYEDNQIEVRLRKTDGTASTGIYG